MPGIEVAGVLLDKLNDWVIQWLWVIWHPLQPAKLSIQSHPPLHPRNSCT